MVEYKTIFFWFGGVLAEPLYKLTAELLVPGAKRREAVRIWQALRKHAERLALGQINPDEYLTAAYAITSSSLPVHDLEARLVKTIKLRREVISVIDSIPEKYKCRLIVDIPSPWLRTIVEADSVGIPFPSDAVDFLSELNISQIVPDTFKLLPTRVDHKKEECLFVDGSSHRAVEAVKAGFSSIVYVYPARLQHELALQGILMAKDDVLHPQSSERVEFK